MISGIFGTVEPGGVIKEAVVSSPRLKFSFEFFNPPWNGFDPIFEEHLVLDGFVPIDVWHTIYHPLSSRES